MATAPPNQDQTAEAQVVEAVPLLPPRPDAIVTLLTTDDFLPGAQTLLYSVKKLLPKDLKYPPELLVLVTPNVSEKTRNALQPAFCRRIEEVEPISFPTNSIDHQQVVSTHVKAWDEQGALTKLHVFRIDRYETVLYLDADCLVVKDISHLLELGKIFVESDALVAAAPDIFPPDKFNAGVMVVRPSQSVFDNMMGQRILLTTYDGGDTGFLNAYFSDWYTDMPPMARLAFGYNAQRFMYHCTYEKQPNYWDLGVSSDLHVIHYSSSPKPWRVANAEDESSRAKAVAHLGDGDWKTIQRVAASGELETLWKQYYRRSLNYAFAFHNSQKESSSKATKRTVPQDRKAVQRLVAVRYKELRREGKDTKMAMEIARAEYGLDTVPTVSASAQVAAMFGL